MPMGIMLAASGFSFREAFSDSSLRGGALIQTVLALWSHIELYRALRTYSPAQLKLRPRSALVFMRWVVVIMVTYCILDILPRSEPVLLILVVAYIAGSIFAEMAPDRFLRAMPGAADNLEPDASSTTPPSKGRASRNRNGTASVNRPALHGLFLRTAPAFDPRRPSLLAFNLGVEAAQLSVLLAVIP
jgi:hypothetical protein